MVCLQEELQQASTPEPEEAAQEPGEAGSDHDQPDTDQWVQCDRCKAWRIVPDADWAAVQADDREDWLCEYATWDTADLAPFTAPCRSGREGGGVEEEEEEEEGEEGEEKEVDIEDGESDEESEDDDEEES